MLIKIKCLESYWLYACSACMRAAYEGASLAHCTVQTQHSQKYAWLAEQSNEITLRFILHHSNWIAVQKVSSGHFKWKEESIPRIIEDCPHLSLLAARDCCLARETCRLMDGGACPSAACTEDDTGSVLASKKGIGRRTRARYLVCQTAAITDQLIHSPFSQTG